MLSIRSSFHRLNVAYNNILRRLLRRPRFCSASGVFVECRIPNCKAVIRNLIFRFMTRLDLSKNSIIFTILGSDIRWSSRIRRHWVKSLYVHHNLVWLLLSYLCYYHLYVLHDKIDCLVLTFCISMCMDRHMYAVLILCVWNKHLSIYLTSVECVALPVFSHSRTEAIMTTFPGAPLASETKATHIP